MKALSSALPADLCRRLICLGACLVFLVRLPAESPAPDAAQVTPAEDTGKEDGDSAVKAPKPDPMAEIYWQAMKLFRDGKAPEWEKGRKLLQEAADGEYTHAQNMLGLCLQGGGYGYPKDAKKAVNWFRLAAERGNAFAKVNMGLSCFNGTGTGKNRDKAAEWLGAAVTDDADYSSPTPPVDYFEQKGPTATDAGDATLSGDLPVNPADRSRALAHYLLGEILSVAGNSAAAQEHYVKAAVMGEAGRAGIYEAAVKAAINFAFGQGVPRDAAKATDMLERGKKLSQRMGIFFAHSLVEKKMFDDFAQADLEEKLSTQSEDTQKQIQFQIAGSFADPKSKSYDVREAVKWYELAAEGKEAWAMLSLAFIYHDGKLGQPDQEKAFSWFKQAAEKGNHLLGYANLGICFQNGTGTPKDTAKAAAIFNNHRNEDIVCYLGASGQCPSSVLTYEQEMELLQTWAKQKKDAHAQYLLGRAYLLGWGVKADLDDAASWFKKAAKSGEGKAMCELGLLFEFQGAKLGCSTLGEAYQQACEYYRKGTEAGDANATANLANMYGTGQGVGQDLNQAIVLYEKCLKLDPNHARAHNNLASIYEVYRGPLTAFGSQEENKKKMLWHYQEADRLGLSWAAFNLGRLAYDGVLGERNFKEAYTYFDTAANRGHTESRRRLGEMHEFGQGVPVTLREAAYHYRLAALDGDMTALTRLCEFYLAGKGVSRDLDRAAYWLNLLAQKGNIGALVTLGDVMLQKGEYETCRKFYTQLTDSNVKSLQGVGYEGLGFLYENGFGVKKNPSKAQRYKAKAFDLGDVLAIYNVAMQRIKEGKKSEAIPLLEKAASSNLPAAMYTLGCLYMLGDGVPKNAEKAWRMLRAASKDGYRDAMYILALSALKGLAGAPSLEEAIQLAESAEAIGHPKAKLVREQLEAKRKEMAPKTSSSESRKM
jgi:hypothetical protein